MIDLTLFKKLENKMRYGNNQYTDRTWADELASTIAQIENNKSIIDKELNENKTYFIDDVPMTPMPKYCLQCSDSYKNSHGNYLKTNKRYKLSIKRNGFMCCEKCGGSYGEVAK